MSNTLAPRAAARSGLVSALLAIVSASVVAVLLCQVVAWVTLAAGASGEFQPLRLTTFATLAVLGIIAGVVGWSLIRRLAADPRRILVPLVPTMLVLSLIPDILVGVNRALPGTTWTGIIGLMVMHVVVTGCVVAACQRTLPVRRVTRAAAAGDPVAA